jgi:predicted site-specific integrase-resolvase
VLLPLSCPRRTLPQSQCRWLLDNPLNGYDEREVILYARVSTRSQKDDLENQIAFLGKHYPNTRLVKDI